MYFKNKTVLITGASRGIGKAIALRLAAEGANIAIAAKSVEENPKLGGTIYTAATEVVGAGGQAVAIACDVRNEQQVQQAVEQTVQAFGSIDVLINNASAISLTPVGQTVVKQFDLMFDINVRGTFLMSQACIPFLKRSDNPHILNLSPPINLQPKWLGAHVAYTMSKYNMTMIALGLAEELKAYPIAANTLWPKTTIATAAVKNLLGGDALIKMSRTPAIVAEAAYHILRRPAATCTGNTFIDEEVLLAEGITHLEQYAVNPGGRLYPDLFL